jgi:hypothetical protein
MIDVKVVVKRGDANPKTYQLKSNGKTASGKFETFSPAAKSADLPDFGKLYVNAKAGK